MKLKALLSALLVAALLCPAAMTEEPPMLQLDDFENIYSEAVDEIVQEESIDINEAEATLGEADESEPIEGRLTEGTGDVAIDAANFPDDSFRDYISNNFDKDNDGNLSAQELEGITGIYVSNSNIADLTGIQLFPNLSTLNCSDNQLTTLDVSHNTKLCILYCNNNQLTTLDVSDNTELFCLYCQNNQFTELDLRNCPEIRQFINSARFFISKDGKVYSYDDKHVDILQFDFNVTIIGGNPVTPITPLTSTPAATTEPTPTSISPISMLKKNNKASMKINTLGQIDLGGDEGTTFKSSKKKVATVDQYGLITAVGAGKTNITVKVGKKKRTLKLTVVDPTIPTSVALSMDGSTTKNTTYSGYIDDPTPTTLIALVPQGTISGIKWKSSNKKVASVDQNGVVTFKKKGKVTITATAVRGKKKAKVKFDVSREWEEGLED